MQYKVGDRVVFNHKTDGFLADGVFTVSHTDTNRSIQYIRLEGYDDWFPSDRFLKIPLFKVEQVVRFKDIKKDKWCSDSQMVNLEGKIGIVMEVSRDCYYADKPYQDGCQYKVKDLQKGNLWYVTSASLELVPTTYKLEDITASTQNWPELRADTGTIATTAEAIAQAVDNVKGPRFKIGDTVVIRNDLVPGKNYIEWGGWNFLQDMAQHRGKVAKIIDYGCDDTNYLRLDIDDGKRSWIVNSLLPYIQGSDYDLDRTTITYKQTKQNYENRLQESDPVISGGKERSGCAICYPGSKTSIGIGHLRDSTTACKC